MKGLNLLWMFVALLLLLILVYCKGITDNANLYTYQPPVQREDGWAVGRLNELGINVRPIEKMIRAIKNKQYSNIHGVLIIKDNSLLLEEYFPGKDYNSTVDSPDEAYDWNFPHYLASCSKSVTSACIGIAIDRGLFAIPGLGQGNQRETALNRKILEFFPQYQTLQWPEQKQRITLNHMLTMSAGIHWEENTYPYLDTRSHHSQMMNSQDPIRFVLELPQDNEPGTRFLYSSGITYVLGGIIKEVSSLPIDDFAALYLFQPLGIEDHAWIHLRDGSVLAGGGLYLRPRDMAKLGQLYLQGGMWNGNRIISQEWIDASIRSTFSVSSTEGYGYQWWTNIFRINGRTIHSFSARGWGGQHILVFPSLNMVVVFTGGNFQENDPVFTMLNSYLLPAAM